jgi:O-antigen ligase
MFLAFTALLLLNRFFTEKSIIYKYGYFIYFITVTINLFINGGRTGQVAFMVSIFVVGFLNVKNKIKSLIIISTLLTLILTTAYQYSPTFKHRIGNFTSDINKLINNHNFNTSIGIRIGFWIVGYEIAKDNPILGVGVGDAMYETKIYADKLPYDFTALKTMPHYHNDFFQFLVTLGLIGAILYIFIFYNIFKINITDVKYKNLPIIFVSVFIISSMFENMFHAQFPMAIFTLFVGLFLAQQKSNKILQ